jgi:adenylate cyclase
MNRAALTHEAPPIAMSALNRRLAAIAFADVAGFSRLMALNDVDAPLEGAADTGHGTSHA